MSAAEPPGTAGAGDPVLAVACREFVELVTEHLEGTLPPDLEQAVARHLDLCDPCVDYLEQMRGTVGLLRDLPTHGLPPEARTKLLHVFTQLHGAQEPAG